MNLHTPQFTQVCNELPDTSSDFHHRQNVDIDVDGGSEGKWQKSDRVLKASSADSPTAQLVSHRQERVPVSFSRPIRHQDLISDCNRGLQVYVECYGGELSCPQFIMVDLLICCGGMMHTLNN